MYYSLLLLVCTPCKHYGRAMQRVMWMKPHRPRVSFKLAMGERVRSADGGHH